MPFTRSLLHFRVRQLYALLGQKALDRVPGNVCAEDYPRSPELAPMVIPTLIEECC